MCHRNNMLIRREKMINISEDYLKLSLIVTMPSLKRTPLLIQTWNFGFLRGLYSSIMPTQWGFYSPEELA